MFGAPPPASAAEIKEQEEEASQAVTMAVAACIALYLSPFAISYFRKLA